MQQHFQVFSLILQNPATTIYFLIVELWVAKLNDAMHTPDHDSTKFNNYASKHVFFSAKYWYKHRRDKL